MRAAVVAPLLALLGGGGCTVFFLGDLSSDDPPPAAPADASSEGAPASGADTGVPATPDGGADAGDLYAAAVLADAPASYWRLEETSGEILSDELARRPLTLRHPERARLGEVGVRGRGVFLNGSTELRVGGEIDLPYEKRFTIEAWIRPTAAPSDDTYRQLFAKIIIVAGPMDGTYVWINASRGALGFERWRESMLVDSVYWDQRPSAERYSHIAVVHDGVLSRLYVDGALASTADSVPEPSANPDTPISWGLNFEGYLDELAFYDSALPASRVKAHFDAATSK